MDNLALLYSDVVAQPEDDAPRSRFADAVREPEWAEFIRLQLRTARARRNQEEYDPSWSTRAEVLRHAHGSRWAGRISQFVTGYAFLRGFVELVHVDAEWFLESADDLYAMAPILHLNFSDANLCAADLFNDPHLRRIRSISFSENDFGDDEARLLAASPHLGNLEWLDLAHNRIGRPGLEALAASSCLPRLGYLRFARNLAPDPTPLFADENTYGSSSPGDLQERFGPRDWLDARPRYRWPPDRDAVG